MMADLSREQMKPFSPSFSVTGVDLFGPFSPKVSRNKSVKAWGAIFTCTTIRAIHLEVVESMSAEAFLHALRRFASHHGWPSTIISDNGTSFVGLERLLREPFVIMRMKLEDFAMLRQFRWIFTMPRSPHRNIRELNKTSQTRHSSCGRKPMVIVERNKHCVSRSKVAD